MQTIINLGTGGADLNGQNGSTTSADSNDALFLDWPGDNAGNYVYLPGVASNYLSVPDEAALDITGDIDIRIQVALDDWTPAAASATLIAKGTGGVQKAWRMEVSPSGGGLVYLIWSADGTSNAGVIGSTILPSVSDGDPLWIRATLDVDNGASGHSVKFYTSDDGVVWTQLGSTITGSGVTSIYSSTSPVTVGSNDAGSSGLISGYVYRAEVWDGIEGSGGTRVLDVDCSQIASGADTSFTALTGQTVSIGRSTSGRKSVAVTSPCWLLGTDDFMLTPHSSLIDFDSTDDFTVLAVVRQHATPTTYGTFISKIADDSGTAVGWDVRGLSTQYVAQALFIHASGSTIAENSATESAGELRIIGMRVNRTTQVMQVVSNGTLSAGSDMSTAGGVSNTRNLRIGSTDAPGDVNDFEFIAAAVFRRALTAAEIAALTTYYQNKVA